MRNWPGILVLSLALSPVSGWAAESLDPSGVPNFHHVNEHLYRGGQPAPQGIKNLAALGVRTVIDLRGGKEHSEEEQKLVEAAGMHYVHVPMAGLSAPSDQQIATLLDMLDNSASWPVFLHCKRGADRTGTVIACYRMTHDHWDHAKALSEARTNGMSWIERGMQQYILHFEPPRKQATSQAATQPLPASQ
jgi:tyrosine-protein phosphatase SIW14